MRLTRENERLQAEVDRLQSIEKSARDSTAELNDLREYVRKFSCLRQISRFDFLVRKTNGTNAF